MTLRATNILGFLGLFLIAGTLYAWGQPPICTCGEVKLWVGTIFSSDNSQHIADWYTLSHILHGVLVALIGRLLFPKLAFKMLLLVAIVTGVGWEIIEHTEFVMAAYRTTTINMGYHGDSVINAVADYIWMMGGFFLAVRLRTLYIFILIAVLELSAALIARESFVLSTIMLLYPIDAIETWQQDTNPSKS